MEIKNKKNHLSRITISFIMLLFAMCLTMNVLFCCNYNLYELVDKTIVIETWTVSESIVANEDGDNITCFMSFFLNENNSHTETITHNIRLIPIIATISKGFSLLLFLNYSFSFLSYFFITLPDAWTLINHKVRLDN